MLRDLDLDQLSREVIPVTFGVGATVHQSAVEASKPSLPQVQAKRWLVDTTAEWGWEELRDYVVGEIQDRQGPIPRDPLKEAAIFKRFVKQWGERAKPIAQYAFGVCDGKWAGAPVGVNRFCKGSDEFFAEEIVRRLDEAAGVVSGRAM